MSHGVTSRSANLTYRGESGGLNEATSDIFGTIVEFFANNANDAGDYVIGEEIYRSYNPATQLHPPHGQAVHGRRQPGLLDDPHQVGRRALLLGPGNHFFYLLSEGSGAKTINGIAYNSPTCNGSHGRRHRPRPGRRDLVPRADGLHDLEHQLRRRHGRHDQRGDRPVRRHLDPGRRRQGRLVGGRGQVVHAPPGWHRPASAGRTAGSAHRGRGRRRPSRRQASSYPG